MEDIKFNYFKEKILKYLSEKENKENEEINKSLITQEYFDRMEKSRGYPVGTIREWKGNKYKKLDAHKWVRVYDKDSSSAKRSIGQIKHMAEQCETSQELMQLILKYRDRFSDEDGRPIPLVQELSSYVSELNDRIELPRQPKEIKSEKHQNRSDEKKEKIIPKKIFDNLLKEALNEEFFKKKYDRAIDNIVNHSPYSISYNSVIDEERLEAAEFEIKDYEYDIKDTEEMINKLKKRNRAESWIERNKHSIKTTLVNYAAVKEGYKKLKEKMLNYKQGETKNAKYATIEDLQKKAKEYGIDVEEKTFNKDQYDEAKNYQLENIPGAKKTFNADEIKTEDLLSADVKPPMFEYNGKKWLVYPPLHTPESYHEFKNNLSEDENKRRNFAILQKQYQKANDIISKAKNITDLSNARDAIKSADKLSERIEGLKELNERFKKAIEKNYKNSMNNIQARYEKNSWPFSFKDDVYETEKPSKMSDDKIKQLENLGFTRWQKNGNDRLYISTYKLPDVETKWQKKDKKLAVIDGKELAYGKSADFFGTKAYIDVDTGEIVVDNDYFADVITNKINSLIDKTQSVKKSFIVKDNRIYIHKSLLGKVVE